MNQVSYQPKGGMCAICVRKHKDCSSLDFSKMQVIIKSQGVAVVKCTSFKKSEDAKL